MKIGYYKTPTGEIKKVSFVDAENKVIGVELNEIRVEHVGYSECLKWEQVADTKKEEETIIKEPKLEPKKETKNDKPNKKASAISAASK